MADALAAMEANRSTNQEETNRTATTTCTCSYKQFHSCIQGNFSGTEGAIGFTCWSEKLDLVFQVSKVENGDRMKYVACTMLDGALTWWNSYVSEGQKIEAEQWNLKVKGTNIVAYTQCFHELALLCPEMVTPETRMIKRYIEGLSQNIKGNVTSSKPIDIHKTITMAQSLMDQVIQDLGEKTVDNKSKCERNHKNNNNHNHNKHQELARVYTAWPTNKGKYAGNLPYYSKCTRHHNGPCPPTCNNCGRVGHMAKDCRTPARATNQGNQNNQRNPPTCYGCRQKGHFKNECPKAWNQGRGNQIRGNQNLSSFLANERDWQDGKINEAVFERSSLQAWSVDIDYFRPRWLIEFDILAVALGSFGDSARHAHCISSSN
ncbi:reverse transcriptase domain-containing protein [Tanacetum coccineum]